LYAMKVISKLPVDEKWVELTTSESETLKNFPSILQENNAEVLASLVAAHARESGVNTVIVAAAPDVSKGKRARTSSESDVAGTKKQKIGVASIPKKRSKAKAEKIITKEQLEKALDGIKVEDHQSKKKKKQPSEPIFTPMVEVTSDMKKKADEQAAQMLAEQKEMEAKKRRDRDERLKASGHEKCDEFFKEKSVQVKEVADKATKKVGASEVILQVDVVENIEQDQKDQGENLGTAEH
jgi:hypothetical protein